MNEQIYKYRIKNNVRIITTEKDNYILKNKEKDLEEFFSYLKSRNFLNYPKIINKKQNKYIYEYIENINMPYEQKTNDIIKLMSSLHSKTTFFKSVRKDKYDEIYELLKEKISYIDSYYIDLITEIEKEIYPSPSHYLISRNYSKIYSAINFCKQELEKWYEITQDFNKQRVSVVHNNITPEHYIKNDKGYFISWDNYIIDTPVLDLYKFFNNIELNNFTLLLDMHEEDYKLNEDERKLLFILLSIPKKFIFEIDEFANTSKVKEFVDYLFKTNDLITPYYSIDSKDE